LQGQSLRAQYTQFLAIDAGGALGDKCLESATPREKRRAAA